jgi:hypothetical protein
VRQEDEGPSEAPKKKKQNTSATKQAPKKKKTSATKQAPKKKKTPIKKKLMKAASAPEARVVRSLKNWLGVE